MNYIYDILLNFNKELYDFYEWNKEDKIIHIKKIPIVLVNNNILNDIVTNNIKIDENYLKTIKNKTEYFENRRIKQIEYSFILTDKKRALAIKLENKQILKSTMIIEEEKEVLEYSKNLEPLKIEYEKTNSLENYEFKTRKEKDIKKYIELNIKKLERNQEIDKLRYLYYDTFNKKETDINKITTKIFLELKNNFQTTSKKLYEVLKMTEKIKK